jgi:hypothetical protein
LAEWGAPAAAALFVTFLLAYLAPLPTPAAEMPLTFGLWTGVLLTLMHASFDYPLQNLTIQLHVAVSLALLSAPACLQAAEILQVSPPPADNLCNDVALG